MSEAIKVTFWIKPAPHANVQPERLATELAVLETTGHWPYPEPAPPYFTARMGTGRVVSEHDGGMEVELELPVENLGAGGFSDLYMAIASGATPALSDLEEAQLVGLELPDALLTTFPGPQWGIPRLRARMGATDDELLIGTIIKPVAGIGPDQVAADCYQAALAGVNFIKDDQKMLNPAYCPLDEKVGAVTDALQKAARETGRPRVLYAPNITARPDRVLHLADAAVAAGAEALMVNFMAAGFPVLEMLCGAGFDVPIYAHCGGKELMTRVPRQGVSAAQVALWARLCGADLLRVSAPGGDLVHAEPEVAGACKETLIEPLPGIKPTLPAVSGGLNVTNLATTLDVCGLDVLVLAGRGVANHPAGIAAGVAAMRQAAQAYRQGISVERFARHAPELQAALAP